MTAQAPIQDNSFFLQEAYNQPPGVVQHILTVEPDGNGETLFTFTQEWPLAGVRHQLAYALPIFCPCGEPGRSIGLGDVALSYRYQMAGARGGTVHVAPEVALALPTGSAQLDRGADEPGFGLTVPVSITLAPSLVAHANAGVSLTPGADGAGGVDDGNTAWLLGASMVWLVRPKLNFLLESVWQSEETPSPAGVGMLRVNTFTVVPGVRGAIEAGRVQIVPGVAVPVTFDDGETDSDWFLYLSVEHAFRTVAP